MKAVLASLFIGLLALASVSANAQEYEGNDCIACSASVAQLDILVQESRDNLNQKLAKMEDTQDITEGKIRAAMMNMIEAKMSQVDGMINDFGLTSDRSLIDQILKEVNLINRLILEL